MGRYDEALEAFKRGGEEPEAYYNLGYMYLSEGSAEEAIEAFQKAIEQSPQFYEKAHENLKRAESELQRTSR
jgi:tetratricopeptide (TPR) repeat protein